MIHNRSSQLTPDKKRELEAEAIKLLEVSEVRPEDPPVDLMKVAANMRVRVYKARFPKRDVSGMATGDPRQVPSGVQPGERATIFINSEDPPTRQKFTLAHELAHVHLGAPCQQSKLPGRGYALSAVAGTGGQSLRRRTSDARAGIPPGSV